MRPAEILAPAFIVGAALFFMFAERRWPYRPQSLLRKGFWLDMLWYNFAQSFALAFAISWILNHVDAYLGWAARAPLANWPFAAQVALFIVTHDLYIYLFHRWQHKSPALWRLHEAHHATSDVDWLSGVRSHPLEILVNQTIEYAPMILLGVHPDVILAKSAIGAVWGMFIHANLDIRLGKLGYVINGPERHRWHHASCDPSVYDTNFATKFSFWDELFGTAYRPGERKPATYGLDDPAFPQTYLGQCLYLFRKSR